MLTLQERPLVNYSSTPENFWCPETEVKKCHNLNLLIGNPTFSIFENPSFHIHFTFDQIAVLFYSPGTPKTTEGVEKDPPPNPIPSRANAPLHGVICSKCSIGRLDS